MLLVLTLCGPLSLLAVPQDSALVSRLLDRIVQQEKTLIESLKSRVPVIETYIQEIPPEDDQIGRTTRDHYFLGRVELSGGLSYTPLVARSETEKAPRILFFKGRSVSFVPAGFAQMIFFGAEGLSRADYKFEYMRREFLGEVRCLVFDVKPVAKSSTGRFIGRIWVDDRENHIVRLNGTYVSTDNSRVFFHFDSWRVNVGPGQWVPAYVYVEESGESGNRKNFPAFKAQTRLWGFDASKSSRLDELTAVLVEAENSVDDKAEGSDRSPIESQRLWERQAEANIIERLERAGLLAPKGELDDVLNTVVTNLIVTSNLNLDVQCRVLLTTPLETFSVGKTIVISRGLIDVLPDEGSLATVLAGELAHIALGHRTNTQFAFNNQMMETDAVLFERLRLARSETELDAAGAKAIAMLSASPYKEKLGNAGLFLKALNSRSALLPNLIHANLGNQLASPAGIVRMAQLTTNAPKLEEEKLEQIAALPLGSRVRVDPWTNRSRLIQSKPVSLLSAREKLPFEIAPFMLYLRRSGLPDVEGAERSAQAASEAK
jgi:hypothetical protein